MRSSWCPWPIVLAAILGLTGSLPAQITDEPDSPPSSTVERPPASAPDEVILKNGSRIVGTLISLEKGKLHFETDFAGTLEIEFTKVQSFTSNTTQTFELEDGTRQPGRPMLSEDGKLRIDTDLFGPLDVEYDNIATINPPQRKPVRHKGSLTMSGRISDGNSRAKNGSAYTEYEARSKGHRFGVMGLWNYSKDRGELSSRNEKGAMQYDFFFREKGFIYAHASFEGDDFADLNLRAIGGGGIGYQVFDSDTLSYFEETGVSYVDEDFDGSDNNYVAARLAGKASWEIVPDKVSLFHWHEFYLGLDDQDDMFADSLSGVRFELMGNFFANLALRFHWDNTPARGTDRTDTDYLLGVGYSFDR